MEPDILKQIEDYAKKNNIPIMQKRGINFLCKYIKEHNVKNILEIGTAIGYSAIKMALVDEDIRVTSIERDETRYLEAIKNIKSLNLDKRITLMLGDALNTNVNEKYDLIFIDAAKAQYLNFFNKYSTNLSDKGAIISDNMSFHGLVGTDGKIESRNVRQLVGKIQRYINFLKENNEYDTIFYEIGDGIAVTVKRR